MGILHASANRGYRVSTLTKRSGALAKSAGKESMEVEIKECHDAAKSYILHDVLFVPATAYT